MGIPSKERTFFNVSAGQLRAFEQRLHEAGFPAEAVHIFNRDPAKAVELVAVAQGWLKPPVATSPSWNAIWDGATEEDWLDRLVARETAVHELRATNWKRELFVETAKGYGREQIEKWERKFLLRFSALPIVDLTQNTDLGWWRFKPNSWYYEQMAAGRIGRFIDSRFQPDHEACQLHGEIVLIDTRLKPPYQDKKQMWREDDFFCGRVIKELRLSRSIPLFNYGSQESRFNVDADQDWQNHLRIALAELLGLDPNCIRLERAIEGNTIPQFYPHLHRTQDGNTSTLVWYEEHYFDGVFSRLHGGDSGYGGLTYVDRCLSGERWANRSFRPLGVLA